MPLVDMPIKRFLAFFFFRCQNVEVKKAEPKGFRPPMGGGVRGGGPFAMPYGDPSGMNNPTVFFFSPAWLLFGSHNSPCRVALSYHFPYALPLQFGIAHF